MVVHYYGFCLFMCCAIAHRDKRETQCEHSIDLDVLGGFVFSLFVCLLVCYIYVPLLSC